MRPSGFPFKILGPGVLPGSPVLRSLSPGPAEEAGPPSFPSERLSPSSTSLLRKCSLALRIGGARRGPCGPGGPGSRDGPPGSRRPRRAANCLPCAAAASTTCSNNRTPFPTCFPKKHTVFSPIVADQNRQGLLAAHHSVWSEADQERPVVRLAWAVPGRTSCATWAASARRLAAVRVRSRRRPLRATRPASARRQEMWHPATRHPCRKSRRPCSISASLDVALPPGAGAPAALVAQDVLWPSTSHARRTRRGGGAPGPHSAEAASPAIALAPLRPPGRGASMPRGARVHARGRAAALPPHPPPDRSGAARTPVRRH